MRPNSRSDSPAARSHHSCERCPKTAPMLRTCASRFLTGTRPSITMLPDVGYNTPQSILMVVDLPAPLAPMYPTISPFSISKEISLTAFSVLYSRYTKSKNAPLKPSRRS